MVGYGDSLRKSRRPGWEDAYLDYDGLKDIRHQLEQVLLERDKQFAARLSFHDPSSNNEENDPTRFPSSDFMDDHGLGLYRDLTIQFASKLHYEIEKVSLFSLSRVGELADAVGALRFRSDGWISSRSGSDLNKLLLEEDVENSNSPTAPNAAPTAAPKLETDSSDGFNFDEFGERGALLPSSNRRSYNEMRISASRSKKSSVSRVTPALFSRDKLINLVGHELHSDSNKIAMYSDLGVELLHLLKFTCLNAVGIRKIVKKYEKLLVLFPITKQMKDAMNTPHEVIQDGNASLMPSEVARRLESIRDDRLRQLSNNESFATICASLLDALAECEKAVLCSSTLETSRHHRSQSAAMVDFLQKSNNLPLLRFECTMSSIHALMDFAHDVSRPFQVFLSRKAMIDTGKDRGELGNSDKKAIKLLLVFEPDFIHDMSESELYEWYRRAITKVKPGKKVTHARGSSFVDYTVGEDIKKWGGADAISMNINLMSTLLYTVNYYIIAPTANHYAILLGTDGAFGASLIGASSFAAIFAAVLYSIWYTRSSFRSALLFSALCPFVGNLMYALAITYQSMTIAILGRVLCGFGSAEVVNRQLISACVSYQNMTKASALFVSISAVGMSIGPLIAAILDMSAGRDTDIDIPIHLPGSPKNSGVIFNHVTMPGFLMAVAWGVQFMSLVFLFSEPERINNDEADNGNDPDKNNNGGLVVGKYGSVSSAEQSQKNSSIWKDTLSLFKILFQNAAFPVTLYLFAFIELVGEVLISSCSMIVRRYFRWHGSRAGLIIASLGALVLPAHFIVERASRFYSERKILKLSTIFTMFSIFAICNYEGLVLDLVGGILKHVHFRGEMADKLKDIVKHSSKHGEFPYDWNAGVFVYISALSAIFIGAIIMEGVNTSLMSKAVPKALNGTFLNMGLLATLVGTLGRVIGDSMITLSAFIGRGPLYDFVSVTYLPLIPVIFLGLYLVNRYYKLLV